MIILQILLGLFCLVAAEDNTYPITKSVKLDHQETETLSQDGRQRSDVQSNNRDYLKRYLFTDVEADGSARAAERWKLIRLSQLLESLGDIRPMPMTMPRPIYREGRTLQGPGSRAAVPTNPPKIQIFKSINSPELEQQLDRKMIRRPTLVGLVWQPSEPGSARTKSNPAGEEVSINSPMHNQPASDYEYKRVENSRWNNLRGMWGKRSWPPVSRFDEESNSFATRAM